jgi:LysR family glycine cleavage system transcriptional activator
MAAREDAMSKGNVPLNALRAFEIAARHLSFTIAAEELNVTQVAVSRQVKALEDYLETPLFIRGNRSLTLTEEGKRLLPSLTKSFDAIYESVNAISMRGRRDVVAIQAYTTFAQRWLIPRLSEFHARYPNIEVRISASLQPVDFSAQNLHAAIRSGNGTFPSCDSELLMPMELIPVCAPSLVESGALRTPEDLPAHTLIQSLARRSDWTAWLQGTGHGHLTCPRTMKFENSALCYEAAMEGIGVAMGMRALISQHIASGKLVMPFEQSVVLNEGYYLIWPAGRPLRGSVRTFHSWLLEEVAKDAALIMGDVSPILPSDAR